jgi:hypothetical protein
VPIFIDRGAPLAYKTANLGFSGPRVSGVESFPVPLGLERFDPFFQVVLCGVLDVKRNGRIDELSVEPFCAA